MGQAATESGAMTVGTAKGAGSSQTPRFPKPSKAARKIEEALKQAARAEQVTKLRRQAIERSAGRCENPDCRRDLNGRGVMDHWHGGPRRRSDERLETVWILCLLCNFDRTENRPDAMTWNARFRTHCLRYGYEYEPHYVNTPEEP